MDYDSSLSFTLSLRPQLPSLSKSLIDMLRDLKIDRQMCSNVEAEPVSPALNVVKARSRMKKTRFRRPSQLVGNKYSFLANVDCDSQQVKSCSRTTNTQKLDFPPLQSTHSTPETWEISNETRRKFECFNAKIVSHFTWPRLGVCCGFQLLLDLQHHDILIALSLTRQSTPGATGDSLWNAFIHLEHIRMEARRILQKELQHTSDDKPGVVTSRRTDIALTRFSQIITDSIRSDDEDDRRAESTEELPIEPLLSYDEYRLTESKGQSQLAHTDSSRINTSAKSVTTWANVSHRFSDVKSSFFRQNILYLAKTSANAAPNLNENMKRSAMLALAESTKATIRQTLQMKHKRDTSSRTNIVQETPITVLPKYPVLLRPLSRSQSSRLILHWLPLLTPVKPSLSEKPFNSVLIAASAEFVPRIISSPRTIDEHSPSGGALAATTFPNKGLYYRSLGRRAKAQPSLPPEAQAILHGLDPSFVPPPGVISFFESHSIPITGFDDDNICPRKAILADFITV